MKILIVRYSALGDVLLTTGVIKYLKEKLPDLTIDILTSPELAEIFESNPSVNKIYKLKKGTGFSEAKLCYQKLPKYDHIFDLQAKTKTRLLQFFVKGKYHRVTNQSFQRRMFVKFGWFKEQLNKHVVEKYANTCLPPLGLAVPTKEDLRPFIRSMENSKLIPSEVDTYCVVHPYASQKNKVWPYFHQLIKKLHKEGKRVVVVGQGQEKWPEGTIDLSNQSSLKDLQAVLSGAERFFTTDSGPMHLGVALKVPTYAFFGPTTKEFGFYPDFNNCWVFENQKLNCRPCHVHGGNTCPQKHFNCMKKIPIESVITNRGA